VARGVYPDHETGGFPLLGSGLDFAEAGSGHVHGGGFEEAIQIAEGLEVLDGHLHLHLVPVAMGPALPGLFNFSSYHDTGRTASAGSMAAVGLRLCGATHGFASLPGAAAIRSQR